MKLIQINTDHYIVVDDSEIKEGDWIIDIKDPLSPRQIKTKHLLEDLFDSEKKITHSTLPLEKFTYDNLSDEVFSMDYHNIKPISLQEVKELIGEVDVKKKMISPYPINTQNDVDWCNGYQRGYNQALEDNKEKKYTEEDLRKAILMARVRIENVSPKYSIDEIFLSLQPKTEWDVEIVDGKLKLK